LKADIVEPVALQVESRQTMPRISRSVILSCLATVLVLATVAVFLHAHGAPTSTQDQEPTDGELRRSCRTSGFYIKSYYSGYYLSHGTTSGSTLSYTSPTSSSIPTWTTTEVSNETFYIKTTSGMYLTLAASSTSSFSSSSALKVQSTGSPSDSMKWRLTLASGSSSTSCNPKFNIAPASYSNYYIQGGTFYPALISASTSSELKFTIETSDGYHPCGTSATQACVTKYCKTGVTVPWSNTSAAVQNDAQTMCNSHCLTCSSWDYNCKSCGGTIDTYNDMTIVNGQQFRQCDCNSALQTAGLSFVSILMIFVAMKLQY